METLYKDVPKWSINENDIVADEEHESVNNTKCGQTQRSRRKKLQNSCLHWADLEIYHPSGNKAPRAYGVETLIMYRQRIAAIYDVSVGHVSVISENGEEIDTWQGSICSLLISPLTRFINGKGYNVILINEQRYRIPSLVRSNGSWRGFCRGLSEYLGISDVWKVNCAAEPEHHIELSFEVRPNILKWVRSSFRINIDHLCPSCYSPFHEGTAFEATEFTESQYIVKLSQSQAWTTHVAWAPDQNFCRQCMKTGIVDIMSMPDEWSLQDRQAACPWLKEVLPIPGADVLYAAVDHFWEDVERQLGKEAARWTRTGKILLEMIQKRMETHLMK